MGAGLPLAAAVKLAVPPLSAVAADGFCVTLGAKYTVSVAGLLVNVPSLLVNTAWYS